MCAVRVSGADEGSYDGGLTVLACRTEARSGMKVVTDGPDLEAARLEQLAEILARHPHICLSCPDRDGCSREECTYGISAEARCCDELGRCELGRLVAYVDGGERLPRRAVAALRGTVTEGRIRREPGLCVRCGRCVNVCDISSIAGRALHLVRFEGRAQATPKQDTLRASGCTFCGQCVMVCPTGALTAPGDRGARWLETCRRRSGLVEPVMPPETWRVLGEVELRSLPSMPGVFLLADEAGRVLRIGGVADLSLGISRAIAEPGCATAARFRIELAPLFTQRESELLARFAQQEGHLPPGNDIGDDLFSDELCADDPFSDDV
jgi:ferredoxin